jgi:hypothetical protein
MTTLHGTMAAVLLAASTTLASQNAQTPTDAQNAQSPPTQSAQSPVELGKDQLHVSGCVAMGEQGKYVLQNATYVGVATRTKAMPQATANPAAPIRSYELSGPVDFKTHVGQKVEVAGVLEKGQDDKPVATSGSTSSAAPTEKLTVTSVKSVASTCP